MSMDAVFKKIESEIENILDKEAVYDDPTCNQGAVTDALLLEVHQLMAKERSMAARRKIALEMGAVVADLFLTNPTVTTSTTFLKLKEDLENNQTEVFNRWQVDIDRLFNVRVATIRLDDIQEREAEEALAHAEPEEDFAPIPAPRGRRGAAFEFPDNAAAGIAELLDEQRRRAGLVAERIAVNHVEPARNWGLPRG